MVSYTETIEVMGIKIPFDPAIITPKIERPMRNNRYEKGECLLLSDILGPKDRLLELGSGVGFLSAYAAKVAGAAAVISVEGNPDLIPVIQETHRLNGIDSVTVINGVASPEAGASVPFYQRTDFWASSMEPASRSYHSVAHVPALGLNDLMKTHRPTVISCDIEGGEQGLFDGADLSDVRHLIVEMHPKVYGEDGLRQIISVLGDKGFAPILPGKPSSVIRFDRAQTTATGNSDPGKGPLPRPDAAPIRVFIPTCMKDEGPFILEWLAWHKAVGITDIVVFTNDLTDGSDALLDALDERGYLTHLPNPARTYGMPALQPRALDYAMGLRQYRQADYVISMDVDEFINIRVGDGTLAALLERVEPFDALSISEVNHGSNGQLTYERGALHDLFPLHQTMTPGPRRAMRGVKTIVRMSPRVEAVRNHRPRLAVPADEAVWLDGSGRRFAQMAQDHTVNGLDCRGRYDLVVLDHFALRSVESFIVKMHRGDVVSPVRQVSRRYWRTRNRDESRETSVGRIDPAARAYFEKHFANDPVLMGLHEACCAAHEARIAELKTQDAYQERIDWILENAWKPVG